MPARAPVLAVALLAGLLAACDTGGDAGDGTLAPGDFGPALAKAYCAQVFACCTAEEIEAADPGYTDASGCVGLTGSLVTGFFTSPVQLSINAGRAAWRDTEAAACVVSVGRASCEELERPDLDAVLDLTGCETVVEPLVAEGAACALDTDCLTGYCEHGGAEQGACRPLPDVGAPCPDYRCAAGAWCRFQQCQAKAEDGAWCPSDEACLSGACDTTAGACVAPVAQCVGR